MGKLKRWMERSNTSLIYLSKSKIMWLKGKNPKMGKYRMSLEKISDQNDTSA